MRSWMRDRLSTGLRLAIGGLAIAGLALLAAKWFLRDRRSDAELLKQAISLADRDQTQAAVPLFDELLSRQPSHGRALLYRGQIARDAGDLAAAARFWKRVPDDPPREGGTARFLEATLYLEANRARDAEAALLKSIALHPEYLQPHERLVKLYTAQLRPAGIERELEAVRRFRPWTFAELYLHTNVNEKFTDNLHSIARAEDYVAADPDDLDSLVAWARFCIWDERDAEAVPLLRRALSKTPRAPALCAYLAEALLGQSDLAGARQVLADAPLGPDSSLDLWRSHGLYWSAAGDWRRAAICLNRAVLLGARDRGTVFKLGQALERAGDIAAANREFQRAGWLLRLHTIMFRLVQVHDNEVPVPQVKEAGDLLMKLNRPADAAEFYARILNEHPDSPEARADYDLAAEQVRAQASGDERARTQALAEAVAQDLAAVGGAAPGEPAAEREPADLHPRASIRLVDHHTDAGIEFQYFNGESGNKYLLETTGGGVGVLDYDADGWPDLYFPQGCKLPFDANDSTYTDRLFRNLGNGSFIDVTAGTMLYDNQYSQGCAAGDYDNDGFTDLAVANFGSNVIYRNHGDGTFGNATAGCGIAGEHWSSSLGWGDLDGDGNLDLVVVNYVLDPLRVCRREQGIISTCHPQAFEAGDDILYVNLGDGSFTDLTKSAGMIGDHGRGLGIVIADFDADGRPDVYIANDGTPSFLFQNLAPPPGQRLKFAEIGLASGTGVNSEGHATAGMGVACGDLDGDGRLDLYITNFSGEVDVLYLNRGELIFEDAIRRAGLVEATRPMLGWGVQAIDFDLDGRPDLLLGNGHLDDRRDQGVAWKMPPQLFYNLGGGAFADVSRDSGEFFLGEYLGRGLARLDWNRDGRPDAVVVHQDRPVALLANESPATGHRVILELHGVQSNRDAIGARLRIVSGGQSQTVEICGGDGFCASNEKRQFIGTGPSTKLDAVEIRWPDGHEDRWTDLPADSELILIEGRPPRIRLLDAR